MKKQLSIALSFAVLVVMPTFADGHKADHALMKFVAAWNGHDSALMATLWTTDAAVVDPLRRSAAGRAEATRLFTQGESTLKVLSGFSVREVRKGESIVQFDGEIVGLRSVSGALLPPAAYRFTAVAVFGPDLPGGHHPNGRYFIASLTSSPVR